MTPTKEEIAEARQQAGMTQEQAGVIVGVETHNAGRQWRRWENGETQMPRGLLDLFLIRTEKDRRNAKKKESGRQGMAGKKGPGKGADSKKANGGGNR